MPVRIGFFRTAEQQRVSDQAKRDYEQRRTAESETRRLYWTARWRAIAKHQLILVPLCEECERDDRVTPATVCNHKIPHRGDVVRFWSGPFESLCKPCHDGVVQAREAAELLGQHQSLLRAAG